MPVFTGSKIPVNGADDPVPCPGIEKEGPFVERRAGEENLVNSTACKSLVSKLHKSCPDPLPLHSRHHPQPENPGS